MTIQLRNALDHCVNNRPNLLDSTSGMALVDIPIEKMTESTHPYPNNNDTMTKIDFPTKNMIFREKVNFQVFAVFFCCF